MKLLKKDLIIHVIRRIIDNLNNPGTIKKIESILLKFLKGNPWEFPGCLIIRILGFHCPGPGSIPGWGRSSKPHGAAKKRNP